MTDHMGPHSVAEVTDRSDSDASARGFDARQAVSAFLGRPLTSLHLVLVSGGLLVSLGIVMVFSASMVDSYVMYGSTYQVFARQLTWLILGLVAFWIGLRLSPHRYRTLAAPVLLLSVVALVLVLIPGIGVSVKGATRWIDLGPLQFQPSEPAKLALALWGADLLVRKERLIREWKHLLIPLVPVATALSALVMLEPDLGTTLCFALVVFGLLWTLGAPGRLFLGMGVIALGALVVLIFIAPYRAARVTSFLDPFADRADSGYQAVQGLYSLSTGGLFGVGLGQSRMKWGLLPEAHTDYIFAILGEELGLIGCVVALSLFGMLAYAGIRIARRSADPFVRIVCGAVTVWLAGQAIINIGYVTGMLPVTGIPLPLISFGGTSLVCTLLTLGMLASFARHEPAALAFLQSRPRGRIAALLLLRPPVSDGTPRIRSARRSNRSLSRPAGGNMAHRQSSAPSSRRPIQTTFRPRPSVTNRNRSGVRPR